jgi:hypothetical protein
MANWTLIHNATDRMEAEMLRGRLEANDIPVVLMDQQSSVYPMMGNIGIHVDRDHVMRALHLLGNEVTS